MSTKIYNGYKLPMMSFLELKNFTDNLRAKILEATNEMFYEKAANLVVNMIDVSYVSSKEEYLRQFKIKEDELNFNLFFKVWEILRGKNDEISKTERRNPYFDFSCEICLIPIEDKILCLFYGEAKEYLDVFNSFKEVESYYYFNNSDEPEDVSEEEWEQRREDWDKALPGIGIPSENGFIVELNKQLPFIDSKMIDEIIKRIPSFEKRINKIAAEQVVSKNMKENSYDACIDSIYWLDTKEGQEQLNEKKKELSEILPKEITNEFLTTKIRELIKEDL